MFTFDRFQIGEEIGRYRSTLRPEDVAEWIRIYGGEAPPHDGVPWGLVSAFCMKSYLDVVSPRPPGNVHTRQHYKALKRPRTLQDLTASVTCTSKEKRRERLIVSITTTLSSTMDQQLLMIGTSTMLWAR